jgi:Fur family ferric uptake transcriptional regulator
MTVAHRTDPLVAPSVAAAVAALRARGLRVSAARRLVLEALFRAGEPVGAEAIASGLDGRLPTSDLASVYRNLDRLEALGLVRHVHLGHGPGLYTLVGRHERGYLACERCGRHESLAPAARERIVAAIRDASGFQASFGHFPIIGLCPDCAGRPDLDEHAHPHPREEGHAHP